MTLFLAVSGTRPKARTTVTGPYVGCRPPKASKHSTRGDRAPGRSGPLGPSTEQNPAPFPRNPTATDSARAGAAQGAFTEYLIAAFTSPQTSGARCMVHPTGEALGGTSLLHGELKLAACAQSQETVKFTARKLPLQRAPRGPCIEMPCSGRVRTFLQGAEVLSHASALGSQSTPARLPRQCRAVGFPFAGFTDLDWKIPGFDKSRSSVSAGFPPPLASAGL